MHIPDGFIDLKTAIATGALAAAGLGLALRNAQRHLPPRRVPLLGLSAAFVFVAQMLNFPVAGGTSGHLVGGVLVAALLGPSAAVIVLASVLIVQCFLFQDGGVTALGANIFNMAIVGAMAGWAIYRVLARAIRGDSGRVIAAFVAGWASTVLASISCAGELAASHKVPWSTALPTMAMVHMLIGIGEGAITAWVLVGIGKARPELLDLNTAPAETGLAAAIFALLIAIGLALFVAPFACGWPDGLEKAAQLWGLKEQPHLVASPLPDYKVPWVRSPMLATAMAGAAGALVVFALAWAMARAIAPGNRNSQITDHR